MSLWHVAPIARVNRRSSRQTRAVILKWHAPAMSIQTAIDHSFVECDEVYFADPHAIFDVLRDVGVLGLRQGFAA
jgi:hypothetical protein